MDDIVNFLNGIIWSNWLIYLCLATGLYFSVVTRFLQIRHIKIMVTYMFQGQPSTKGVSPFQAFALAVSGRVGTGNIAGVATAIAMGGPGAVFWMWAIAFLGAGSAFVEATLAQIYKRVVDGEFRGGPAYYIEQGLKVKWYAIVFAIATILGTGIFLPGIQSNSIANSIETAFGLNTRISGIIIIALLGLIIFGGIKRISLAAQYMVPFMAMGYIVVAVIVILANASQVPNALALIFKSAFGFEQAFAGTLGMAISWGVKRGIYSNEAGQGTAPMAAAAAEVSHPAKQGLVQAFSVYFDTWFVCTATAIMILVTGTYNVSGPDGTFLVENLAGVDAGPQYTQYAIESLLPGFGSVFVAVALFFFAFTTMMAYYYYTETNIAYIIKQDKTRRMAINAMRIIFLGIVFMGAVRSSSTAWAMGDVGVGLMAWVNIVAILLLSKPAIACLRDLESQVKLGKDPVFKAKDIGIENTDCWK
ncbi:alanine:cation symporter family protein [Puniceicoccaceae bacterium K14]|nr:alanine:cation symporter family protein [Puniceicoccaceae bacterium K14]